MRKQVLGVLALSALLGGCSNNSVKNVTASSNSQHFSQNIYGELLYENGEYRLSDKFYVDSSRGRLHSGVTASFVFDIPALRPAFNTQRFECERSFSVNGCEAYEDKRYIFQYVNFFKSDYGEVNFKRATIGSTAKKVATHILYSPGYLGGALGFGAAAVIFSPFIIGYAIVEPNKFFKRKNYVEFHHEDFEDEVIDAIADSSFGSLAGYISAASNTSKLIAEVETAHSQRQKLSQVKRDELKEAIAKFYINNDPPVVDINYLTLPTAYSSDQKMAAAIRDKYLKKIQDHYAQEDNRILNEYRAMEPGAKENYKQEQISRFASLNGIGSVQAFISTFKSLDIAGLVPQAEVKLKQQLAAEESERIHQAEVAEKRRAFEALELEKWRGSLSIGSDTFCGPVIDINQVMVKIAVKVPLPGYSSEAWLKRSELYPPSYGCQNRNGVLSPYS